MSAFRVAVDSSCIIGLTHIGLWPRLSDIFREIMIPEYVYHEVVIKGRDRPGAADVKNAIQKGWLVQRTVRIRWP